MADGEDFHRGIEVRNFRTVTDLLRIFRHIAEEKLESEDGVSMRSKFRH